MKRFFARIGRFFWSRGFLKFVLWTATLIILFYVEEDWRGARAWAATKAEWEAKGESFDLKTFIPPPIPNDQNLADIPVFKLELVQSFNGRSYFEDTALRKALGGRSYDNDFPPTNNWRQGELPDMEKIRQIVSKKYAVAFKNGPPLTDPLAQLDALYLFIVDLRAVALKPFCRFPYDAGAEFPAARSLGLITSQILISKIQAVHALLELENHQPDLAAEDLKINFKLATGVGQDPSFVSAMVTMGITAISNGAIYDGLAHHAWKDDQLANLQSDLARLDFLSLYQFATRCEIAENALDIDYIKHARPSEMYGFVYGSSDSLNFWDRNSCPAFWPDGWWDLNKAQTVIPKLNFLASVDPKNQRVFPAKVNELIDQLHSFSQRRDAHAPWNILSTIMSSDFPQQLVNFASTQNWVDEARIACALERYRLVRGAYPDSLDALAPAYIDIVPHDIMNGEPYRYQLRSDGTFLLYSVGWNEKDDGGKVVYKAENPNSIDYQQGDWVWPTPKSP